MSRKTEDEITDSQWLAVLEADRNRESKRPPGSRSALEIARLWKLSIHHTRIKLREKVLNGTANQTMVGVTAYYTLK